MMRLSRRHAIRALTLTAAIALASALPGSAAADTAGTVHFVRSADTAFNQYTSNPSPEQQAWLRAHMWRMMVWSPYFDEKTSWYGQGWVYKDAYAIYRGSALAAAHPDWILKSASGSNLYIPFGCSGGSCPQYAGDISNPAFRHYWIEEARSELAHGYRGLFIDDVNMEERVGDGAGNQAPPISPSSGEALTPTVWRTDFAQFLAEVRAAFPGVEIAHNTLWFANSDAGTADPAIRKQVESANYILLERGVNDSGLTGGSGQWSLNALFAFIDQVHALGRAVVLDGSASEPQGLEYNLASYFLVSAGNDAVSGSGQTPANWWAGWNVNLGEASAARYSWNGVLRRDFAGGIVLVNPPGSPTRTIALPAPMQGVDGATVSSVTLPAASGAVLRGASPVTPAPVGPAPEVPTQTIVETTPVPSSGGASGSSGSGSSPQPKGSSHHHARHKRHPRAHRASRRAPRRAAMTRIKGLVRHASKGSVAIEVDRFSAGRWHVVRRLRASLDGSGRFTRLLVLHTALRYRVRASYTGTSGYRPSRSQYRLLVLHVR